MGDIITDRRELKRRVDQLKAQGKTVIFCNGAFDIIHVGHVRYLYGAKAEGDILVVGINTDESIRRYKGPNRPLQPLAARMEIVAAFKPVDFVTCFDEPTADALLECLRPAAHAKGPEYTPANLPEYPTIQRLGIRLATVGGPKDHSSTDLLGKLDALGI